MLRALVVIFGLYFATTLWAYEQKMIMIENENVFCGPTTCPLNVTSMCFYTSRITQDSRNGSYMTTCGTCLSPNGSTIRESCNTEPIIITNATNLLAISLTNSTLDQTRMRNAMSGLLMSEMAIASGKPSIGPSVSYTTPPSSYYPQQSAQPIIVVQPPAQQIYFNGPPPYGLSRPIRSPDPNDCYPDCPPIPPPSSSSSNFKPNVLPPQLNELYNLARSTVYQGQKMMGMIQDMSAGLPIPYMSTNNPGTPPVKQNFPVFTPETNFY